MTAWLTLPLSSTMTAEQVDDVCDCVIAVLGDSSATANKGSIAWP